MKTIIKFLILCLFFSGCATIQVKQFIGPNGGQAYSLQCGSDFDGCYQKAGELCPGGYEIIDRASSVVAVPASGGGVIAAPRHNLAVQCK